MPPKVWCNVEFLTNNSVLMVICDKDYDFKDYLETFEDFQPEHVFKLQTW